MNRRYRKTIIAGNWKMNKTPAETKEFIAQLKPHAARAKWCETVLCVPYIDLPAAVKAAKNTRVFIAAQNMHHAESGAYTGEVSAPMLCSLGVKYVVVGHSERRQYFGETDEIVAQKVQAALKCGLRPIVCVGESLAQREKNLTLDHVRMQIKTIFFGVDSKDVKKIVVAYEPIWAIGTGKTATAEQADEVGRAIRECIREIYGARHARSVTILYGGSMNPQNAGELLAMPDVDGGLIGGASLDWEKFVDVMESANQ
ncbi:triose-phosphate isomerase [Intestinimonas butyriciproducens]|uniref:triose-phosphate isomerase n=1 Tax=Intestinimonas butyriciproducens TaxID=1297617 RepID=UPI00195D3272|nr:triose-phosphate isomerase [Intestinimonas butyriciproducens]MBM6917812.1 triose-phosphate isomerase [Intestinimonas butyriciproducens]